MPINYKKIKSQIKSFKYGSKLGYIFLASKEQENIGLCSVAQEGSKRSLLKSMSCIIHDDKYFKKEFQL
jgi:hypothetical protein